MGWKSLWVIGLSCALSTAGVSAGSVERFTDAVAEAPHLQSWREERGSSFILTQLYQSYSNEALYQMADNGDIYALLVAYERLRNAGQTAEAYLGLMHAAALGSSAALIMAGEALYRDSLLWQGGALEADSLRTVYGLPAELEASQLTLSAAAHYVAAALMGDVDRADIQMEQLLTGKSVDFMVQHWPTIEAQAENLLRDIARYRSKELALPDFDHGYPDAYARYYGLPFGRVDSAYLLDRWR